jgi:hypothetical protein
LDVAERDDVRGRQPGDCFGDELRTVVEPKSAGSACRWISLSSMSGTRQLSNDFVTSIAMVSRLP